MRKVGKSKHASDTLRIQQDKETGQIFIKGALDLAHFAQAEKALKKLEITDSASLDLSEVTHLDTAGALLLQSAVKGKGKNQIASLAHLQPHHQALFTMVANSEIGHFPARKKHSSLKGAITRLGKATIGAQQATVELITFTGHTVATLGRVLRHPSRLRMSSILHHMEAIGIDAIPIISLIAVVISIVVCYQGQVQLKALGAQQYTVNLIAISVMREMGVLLTAIMIAGRSGSAFAAEIGTMSMREEVDALRSLGFDPFEILVLPRLIALVVTLPLMTLLSDIMGLLGGAMISLSLIDISLAEYLERARHAVHWNDLLVGLIKAPVFGFVIALVGCMHGLKVAGSAEAVGRETTASVVQSIFLILVLDGLFSIYFQKVNL